MVVSPQNPFKSKKSLAPNYDRLHLVRLATEHNPNIEASKIEFDLPVPSYTIDTLTYLKERYPKKEFSLIMGGDNLSSFHKWKNYQLILKDHDIYVYKRPRYRKHQFKDHPKVKFVQAPLLDISATFIRKNLKEGKSIQYLVPHEVFEYLNSSRMYKD